MPFSTKTDLTHKQLFSFARIQADRITALVTQPQMTTLDIETVRRIAYAGVRPLRAWLDRNEERVFQLPKHTEYGQQVRLLYRVLENTREDFEGISYFISKWENNKDPNARGLRLQQVRQTLNSYTTSIRSELNTFSSKYGWKSASSVRSIRRLLSKQHWQYR